MHVKELLCVHLLCFLICLGRKQDSHSSNLLHKACGVLADLHEAHDDIVQVDVTQRGVVFTLPPRLVQQQIPTVHWGKKVLVFPADRERGGEVRIETDQLLH